MLSGFDEDLSGIDAPEEVKAKILEAANKRAAGLVDKNKELLGKLSNTKEEYSTSASELERLRVFEAQALQEQEAAKGNYNKALEMTKSRYEEQLKALNEQASSAQEQVKKLLINDGLNKALDGVKVNPLLKSGAEAMFLSQATISDGKAMVGEKTLSEAVNEWSQTDAGKAFCLAAENSNGGGNGGKTPSSENTPQSNLSQRLKAKGLI